MRDDIGKASLTCFNPTILDIGTRAVGTEKPLTQLARARAIVTVEKGRMGKIYFPENMVIYKFLLSCTSFLSAKSNQRAHDSIKLV